MTKYASYILYLLISILVAILYINDFGPLSGLQRNINDNLQSLTASEDQVPNVVLVTIDAAAQNKYGPWPWDHDLIADLTAAVASGEPKVITLDFEIREDAEQERQGKTKILADQLEWMDNVVLPYDLALATFRSTKTNNPDHLFDYSVTIDNKLGVMSENSSLIARKLFLPASQVLELDPYLGFNYVMPDEDRVLRHQPMLVNYEGYYYPSLPLMTAQVYLGVPSDMVRVAEGKSISVGNDVKFPINDRGEYFVNFYKNSPFTRHSASKVLEDGFNFASLKGKAVIISVDDFTNTEYFQTPVNGESPRQEVLASAVANIINRDFVSIGFDSTLLNLLVLFILGGVCAFVMPQIPVLYRYVSIGIALFILVNVNYFLMSSFNVLVQLVYISLELLLFMGAAPLLESSLVLGDQAEAIKKKKEKEKFKKNVAKASAKIEPKLRELKTTGQEEDEIATVAVAEKRSGPILTAEDKDEIAATLAPENSSNFGDHQALKLDDDKESKHSVKPKVSPSTMIGKKTKDSEGIPSELAGTVTGSEGGEPEIISPDKFEQSDSGGVAEGGDSGDMEMMDDSVRGMSASPIPTDLKKLGRYQVTGILGRGAMGQVYKGIDPNINRPIALKTIRLDFVSDPAEMAELKERLTREAQAAGKLSHPNIVTIYDAGSEGDLQYIAMEYLEGRTLESMIKKKVKFNYRIISQIIVQICAALDYAHQQGIVHRDIKPANIMILNDYRVKVMDFGIARVDSNSMTKTGIAMGTPNYISPEQLKGQQVDSRADLFSLGVVMYEMLLGKRPFKGENITSLIYSIINQEPEKPSNVNPQIPLLFDHVVGRALKKKPAERYQRATEIVSDLADFVESFSGRRR
jgi:serine/threonine-protein kinase